MGTHAGEERSGKKSPGNVETYLTLGLFSCLLQRRWTVGNNKLKKYLSTLLYPQFDLVILGNRVTKWVFDTVNKIEESIDLTTARFLILIESLAGSLLYVCLSVWVLISCQCSVSLQLLISKLFPSLIFYNSCPVGCVGLRGWGSGREKCSVSQKPVHLP